MAEIIPITPPPKKDGYGVYPEAVCVERAAGGYGILNLPMTTVPMSPKGSKEESAGAVCWLVNKGVAQLPENAPWLADFKNELENFPLTTYKDQTDAFVHALAWELRKTVDFEPAMMERYAALNVDPRQQLLAEVEDELINQIYKDEWVTYTIKRISEINRSMARE